MGLVRVLLACAQIAARFSVRLWFCSVRFSFYFKGMLAVYLFRIWPGFG